MCDKRECVRDLCARQRGYRKSDASVRVAQKRGGQANIRQILGNLERANFPRLMGTVRTSPASADTQLLLAPESGAGCSCTHSIQTSVGYLPRALE